MQSDTVKQMEPVLARLRQRSGAEDLESLDSSATRYVLDLRWLRSP